jgi:hypothetical protein
MHKQPSSCALGKFGGAMRTGRLPQARRAPRVGAKRVHACDKRHSSKSSMNIMTKLTRIAFVGDVHKFWDLQDVAALVSMNVGASSI